MKITTLIVVIFSLFFFTEVFAGGKGGKPIVLEEKTIYSPPLVHEEEEVCKWVRLPMESITAIPVVNYPILVPVSCDGIMVPFGGGVVASTFSSGYRLSRVCKKVKKEVGHD